MATRAAREGGFTLLEVIVALAVTALVMGALLQAFGGGLRSLQNADRRQQASLMARSLLDEGLLLESGDIDKRGEDGPFRWQRSAREVSAESLGAEGARDWRPYLVEVTVSWEEERSLTLASLKLEAR